MFAIQSNEMVEFRVIPYGNILYRALPQKSRKKGKITALKLLPGG